MTTDDHSMYSENLVQLSPYLQETVAHFGLWKFRLETTTQKFYQPIPYFLRVV